MAYDVKLREEMEKRLGGKVQWRGVGQPIGVEYGGKTYDIAPSEYRVQEGSAVVSPDVLARITGYVPVRSTLEQKGYSVGWDEPSRTATAQQPLTGQQVAIEPAAVWGGRSYVPPEKLAEVEARLTPSWEKTGKELQQQYTGLQGQIRDTARQYFDSMNQYIKQMSDAGLNMYKAYQDQLSQAFALMRSQMERSPEVPQSVKIALSELQEQVNENAKLLGEEMNRRGIYQSGIATEEERKLRERGLKESDKILAQWLDREHENMTRAAFQLANMYAQTAGPMAQMYYQATTAPLQMGAELMGKQFGFETEQAQKGYDVAAALRKWQAEQEAAAQKLRAEQEMKAQELAWEQQKALLPYQYMTPYQSAKLALDEWRYRRQLALAEQRLRELSPADVRSQAKANRMDRIVRYMDDVYAKGTGKDPAEFGKDISDALADIEASILGDVPMLYEAGLTDRDIADLIDKAYYLGTGKTRKEFRGETGAEALTKALMQTLGG